MSKIPSLTNSALQVEVISPVKTLFQGFAQAITSTNEKGAFDILPGHTPFITIIHKQVVVHENNQNIKKFELQNGVLRCHDNIVRVYIGL